MKYMLLFLSIFFSSMLFAQTIPFQYGWPRQASDDWGLYTNSPTVGDINNNGNLEVSVTKSFATPVLHVWRTSGAFLPGFPFSLPPGNLQQSSSNEISAIGDVTGDGYLEIVLGDENGQLFVFRYNGSQVAGSPFFLGSAKKSTTPALVDLDDDGKLDIVITSFDRDSPYMNAQLHVLKWNGNGFSYFDEFPLDIIYGSDSSPVVGDLNGNGQYEIVFVTNGNTGNNVNSKIHAINTRGEYMNGFPIEISPSTLGSTPSLYDIDSSGTLEIVIRVMPAATGINGIYAYNYLGQLLPQFPFPVSSGHPDANVAIADMTGNGKPEFAFGSVQAVGEGKVWVWDINGNLLPNFPQPIFATWVDGSVAIGDVSGDGFPDVVAPTSQGFIYAFDRLGQLVPGFPLEAEDVHVVKGFQTSPTLVDIDGDGDIEIFAGSLNRRVYGWDTPGLVTESMWSTFKGNPQRTGGMLRGFVEDPVPVELFSFNASLHNNIVSLNWSTASETNNMGFEIERTSSLINNNGKKEEWKIIAFIPGNGTTTEINNYTFNDEINSLISIDNIYYRLKQIDLDGSFVYTNTVEVNILPFEFALQQNYPNPFNPSTKISYKFPANGRVTLKIYDLIGNEIVTLVDEQKEAGFYEVDFNASLLSSGVYFYTLTTSEMQQTKKMILMR